ncbi:MAG TPA: DUF3558 family protein [Acidimicrobiales bacterium]|nr:DUF3558 family protein [Acidimicrobiales bacterium]
MPASRRHLRLLAALFAVGLFATACSDDDSTDDPTIQDGGDDGGQAAADGPADEGATDDGEDGGGDGGDAGDPCSLITQAQLQEAFGSPWDEGEATEQAETGGDQCTWTNTDAPPVKTFSVVVYTNDGLEGTPVGQGAGDVAGLFELNKGAVTVDEELEIGDDAFRAATNVWVLDGDTLYNFSTFLGDSEEATAGLVDLAEQTVDG